MERGGRRDRTPADVLDTDDGLLVHTRSGKLRRLAKRKKSSMAYMWNQECYLKEKQRDTLRQAFLTLSISLIKTLDKISSSLLIIIIRFYVQSIKVHCFSMDYGKGC